MKFPVLAFLAALPLPAAAQSFEGVVVDLQYQTYDDGAGFNIENVEGYLDAAWSFGRFGVQVGLSLGDEVYSTDDFDATLYKGISLHATADASDRLRLGGMVLIDNAIDNAIDGVSFYAAEALYLSGPLRVEGRLGDSFDEALPYTFVDISAGYAINDALTARAGVHYGDFGDDGFYRVFRIGGSYRIGDRTEIYADVNRHTNDFGLFGDRYDGSLVNAGIRFDLGGNSERLFIHQVWN